MRQFLPIWLDDPAAFLMFSFGTGFAL